MATSRTQPVDLRDEERFDCGAYKLNRLQAGIPGGVGFPCHSGGAGCGRAW